MSSWKTRLPFWVDCHSCCLETLTYYCRQQTASTGYTWLLIHSGSCCLEARPGSVFIKETPTSTIYPHALAMAFSSEQLQIANFLTVGLTPQKPSCLLGVQLYAISLYCTERISISVGWHCNEPRIKEKVVLVRTEEEHMKEHIWMINWEGQGGKHRTDFDRWWARKYSRAV